MTEWKGYKLGEIAAFVKEKVAVQSIATEKYISTENMLPNKGGIIVASGKPEEGTITKYYPNTILISNIRPYFKKIWYADKEGGCSNDVLCFEAKEDVVESKYLFYLLSQDMFFDYVMLGSKGCKMPRGDKAHIMNWDISLPSLNDQHRITAILTSLDDKIDLLRRENATLEAMAETLFRQWLVVEAKEEWEEGTLADLIDIGSGKGLQRADFVENGQYSVFGANGEIGRTDKFLVDESDRIVFTGRVGTLGNVFRLENKKAWLSDNTLVIKPKEYYNFVYFVLKLSRLQDYNVGSTQPLIRQSDIKEIELALPGRDILNAFEKECDLIYEKVENNNNQIQTLIQTRDGLLPKLMSNEIKI